MSDGWIDYDGNGQPVADDVIVEIMILYEAEEIDEPLNEPDRADYWDWSIEGVEGDIVAYRIVEGE